MATAQEYFDGRSYASERAQPGLPKSSAKKLAKGLGWFSIGLGVTELLAPKAIAKICGVSNAHTGLIRVYSLREIAAGVMIFSQTNPAAGMWSRVAGDALDLATLGKAFASPTASKGLVAFATANVAAVTALDLFAAQRGTVRLAGAHLLRGRVADHGPQCDERRPLRLGLGGLDGLLDRDDVLAALDDLGVPPVGLVARDGVLGQRDVGVVLDR